MRLISQAPPVYIPITVSVNSYVIISNDGPEKRSIARYGFSDPPRLKSRGVAGRIARLKIEPTRIKHRVASAKRRASRSPINYKRETARGSLHRRDMAPGHPVYIFAVAPLPYRPDTARFNEFLPGKVLGAFCVYWHTRARAHIHLCDLYLP